MYYIIGILDFQPPSMLSCLPCYLLFESQLLTHYEELEPRETKWFMKEDVQTQ